MQRTDPHLNDCDATARVSHRDGLEVATVRYGATADSPHEVFCPCGAHALFYSASHAQRFAGWHS